MDYQNAPQPQNIPPNTLTSLIELKLNQMDPQLIGLTYFYHEMNYELEIKSALI